MSSEPFTSDVFSTSPDRLDSAGARGGVELPSSVRMSHVVAFGAALCACQLLTRTEPVFALLVFAFVVLSGLGFNMTGGLTTTAGVGVTMVSLKIVIVSQVAKLLHGQAADSYLEVPQTTMAVLVLGLGSLIAGWAIGGTNAPRQGWLRRVTDTRSLLTGSLISLMVGGGAGVIVFRAGFDLSSEQLRTGGIVGIARQFVVFAPLATIFATAYTITASAWKRSLSMLVLITMVPSLGLGLLAGSKMGVVEPFMYYALTCLAWRFPFRRAHYIWMAAGGIAALLVVWPVMQAVKGGVTSKFSFSERLEMVVDTFAGLSSVSAYLEVREDMEELLSKEQFQYYGRPAGWLDRFSLIEQDDELVLATLQQGETGWYTITHAFRALVPSFIDPNKPTRNTGSFLGHRIGSISDDDDDTQISFGVIAEAFSAFGWIGVVLFPGLLMLLFSQTLFRTTGAIWGDVWAVYLIGKLQHSFVEFTISAFIQTMLMLTIVMFVMSAGLRTGTRLVASIRARDITPTG